MKNILQLPILVCLIFTACNGTNAPTNKSNDNGTSNVVYYDKLTTKVLMSILSAKATPISIEDIRGNADIDTFWLWTPKKNDEISDRYRRILDATQVNDSITPKRVRYNVVRSFQADSLAGFLYSVRNSNRSEDIYDDKQHFVGLAVFRKNKNGWYLKKNDYQFFENIKKDNSVISLSYAGVIDGQPAALMISDNKLSSSAISSRQLLLVQEDGTLINLHPSALPPPNYVFEVDSDDGEGTEFGCAERNAVGEKIFNLTSYSRHDFFKSYSLINSQGNVVGFRYYKKNSIGKDGLILEGKVIERVYSRPTLGIHYAMNDLWKNYYSDSCFYFSGKVFQTYAKGKLADSTVVKRDGVEKWYAQTQSGHEGTNRRGNDFDPLLEMKAQQDASRAVDNLVREQGLCSYCAGKGCLQCGGTGRLQKH